MNYSPSTASKQPKRFPSNYPAEILKGKGAYIYDEEGNIWIGHYTGAYKYSDNIWTNYSETDGLISNYVTCFAVDQQNNMWIGTGSGLSRYDGTGWTNYTTSNGLLDNNIKALACDKDGNIWIGCPLGLTIITKE